jgi:hypothetical protein
MPDWLAWLKGLTLTNVLVIGLMAMVAVPVYFVWRVMGDPALLDRFLSHYKETGSGTGCTIREARQRGGPVVWSISTGFAHAGSDRWMVSVILTTEPEPQDVESYCATLELIVAKMLDDIGSSAPRLDGPRRTAGPRVQRQPVPCAEAGQGRQWWTLWRAGTLHLAQPQSGRC